MAKSLPLFFLPITCGVGGHFADPPLAFFADFVVSDRHIARLQTTRTDLFERVLACFFGWNAWGTKPNGMKKKEKKTNSFGSISSNYIDNTSICNQTDWHVGQNHPCVGALCRLGQGWVIFQLWSCIALRLHLCAIALAGTWRWKSARIPLRATLRSWLHEFAQVAEAFRYWTWYWVVSIKIILLNTIC